MATNADIGISNTATNSANASGTSTKSALSTASNLTSNVTASATAISNKYVKGQSRLVDFTYIDGTTDDSHRAYLKLEDISGTSSSGSTSVNSAVTSASKGTTSAAVSTEKKSSDTSATNTSSSAATITTGIAGLKASFTGNSASVLNTVLAHLQNGYTSVIINSVQENLQERQHILPTVGDSFALTFTGKEPQVLVFSGYLPFDYAADNSYSWYASWVNGYKYIFRASILARYNLRLRLIFPDFSEYYIYPVSLSCSMSADNDTLIPFTMSAYVVNMPFVSASVAATSTLSTTNPANILVSALNSNVAKNMASLANQYGTSSATGVSSILQGANGFMTTVTNGVTSLLGGTRTNTTTQNSAKQS